MRWTLEIPRLFMLETIMVDKSQFTLSNKANLSTPSSRKNTCIIPGFLFAKEVDLTCLGHRDWAPVSKTNMLEMLHRVNNPSDTPTSSLPPQYFALWVESQIDVEDILNSGIWEDDECRFCNIESFLMGPAKLVWLVGLHQLAEVTAWNRSLYCLESLGVDIHPLIRWVQKVISGKWEEASEE
jgi:hypothetical protein